ncbi:MAG: TIGR03960 family B12-binding radical SAM protein [Clostridiales bacterium]|nr:TIGR03960 family B12-binding radical SAM protein [Clostridiales bacterium]
MLSKELKNILLKVQKPGRYTGGELNSVVKNRADIAVRYAFCFPDTYEIGMSHLGMKILYGLVNEREDAWCERVFAPWLDMEEQMRKNNIPLYALESGDPIAGFDIIGFTLQYELCYTNVLNMLDLAGLPVRSADRKALTPIVIAGGPCVCNPEPLAPFIDLFLPGEGEEVTNDIIDLIKKHKALGSTKEEFLKDAVKIQGVYAPSFYSVEYNSDDTVKAVTPSNGAPEKVKKRIVSDLDSCYYPDKFVVPFLEVVHDRTTAELFRGCIRGCRFCQAGFLYRPIREKAAKTVEDQCRRLCDSTGYDEISLCSLSTSDYTKLFPLLNDLLEWTEKDRINIALPSLRIDNFPEELMQKISGVRRSGLTFAPEAGTQRLRDVINKNVTEEEVMSTAKEAFDGGWTAVKLYFMIGLPTETLEDVEGIAKLAQKVVDEFYHNPNKPKGKSVTVSVSASTFVPKPFTPFQWEAQDTAGVIAEKQKHLFESNTTRKVNISCHKVYTSVLEGVFARGDRRLAEVIETAWRSGCKFDGWDDVFDTEKWTQAFEKCNISPEFYASRQRSFDEVLPWDHMDYGISKNFLINENKRAHEGVTTPSCREKCSGCGTNKLNGGVCHALCKSMA